MVRFLTVIKVCCEQVVGVLAYNVIMIPGMINEFLLSKLDGSAFIFLEDDGNAFWHRDAAPFIDLYTCSPLRMLSALCGRQR